MHDRWLLAVLAGVLLAVAPALAAAQERVIPRALLRSGIAFAGPDVQALQDDAFANPGMLWVQRGEALWSAVPAQGEACAGCHGAAAEAMRGVATHYPRWDASAGRVIDLEDRIDACRTTRQRARPWPRGSDELLAMTAYVVGQSRGQPMAVRIDDAARPAFERARAFYYQRHGQMNVSCAQCHEENWGRHLLRETLSQGHPTAFPAYRLEWQSLGSLQRRLRACLFGVRAEMPPEGDPLLTELELFLAWRAEGLPIETPGVRR